jgi:hypothetical protein
VRELRAVGWIVGPERCGDRERRHVELSAEMDDGVGTERHGLGCEGVVQGCIIGRGRSSR